MNLTVFHVINPPNVKIDFRVTKLWYKTLENGVKTTDLLYKVILYLTPSNTLITDKLL